jgi:proline dehydrogenase
MPLKDGRGGLGVRQSLVYPIAKRFIAGKTMGEATSVAHGQNAKGIGVILNFLGEEITESSLADSVVQEYVKLQNTIASEKIDGFTSVKLTQLGLAMDVRDTESRLEQLAKNAESHNQILYVDIEDSTYLTRTIEIFEAMIDRHKNMGLAYQCYLRKGEPDFVRLVTKGARIRLVKGAYSSESPEVVYKSRDVIRNEYSKYEKILFERGNDFGIATHDTVLVDEAKKLAESNKKTFHFEFLRGIRNELKEELVGSGYRVYDYVPYGDEWYNYSMRRVKEHPSNILLLIRSLV